MMTNPLSEVIYPVCHSELEVVEYPFEVAKLDETFNFYRRNGSQLTQLLPYGGSLACNQYVFRKEQPANSSFRIAAGNDH